MSDPDVTVRLPHDEAMVLLEGLYTLSDRPDFNKIVSHPAERVAVWARGWDDGGEDDPASGSTAA